MNRNNENPRTHKKSIYIPDESISFSHNYAVDHLATKKGAVTVGTEGGRGGSGELGGGEWREERKGGRELGEGDVGLVAFIS